jgi:hypothetical protein
MVRDAGEQNMKSIRLPCLVLIGIGFFGGFAQGQQLPSNRIDFAYFVSGITADLSPFAYRSLWTGLTVINPGTDPAEVEVRLLGPPMSADRVRLRRGDGALGESLDNPFTLPPRSGLRLTIEIDRSGITIGHLQVSSNVPLAALEHVRLVDDLGGLGPIPIIRVLSEVQLPPAEAVSSFSISVEETGAALTGLSIAPAEADTPVHGTLTLIDSSGAEQGTQEVTIQPGEQFVRQVVELLPALADIRQGTVEGRFDGPVLVSALGAGRANNRLERKLIASIE